MPEVNIDEAKAHKLFQSHDSVSHIEINVAGKKIVFASEVWEKKKTEKRADFDILDNVLWINLKSGWWAYSQILREP